MKVLKSTGSHHAIEAARRGAADQDLYVEVLVVDVTGAVDLERFGLVVVNQGLPSPDRGRDSAFTFVDRALAPGGTLLVIDYAKPVAPPSDSAGVATEELVAAFRSTSLSGVTQCGEVNNPSAETISATGSESPHAKAGTPTFLTTHLRRSSLGKRLHGQ